MCNITNLYNITYFLTEAGRPRSIRSYCGVGYFMLGIILNGIIDVGFTCVVLGSI